MLFNRRSSISITTPPPSSTTPSFVDPTRNIGINHNGIISCASQAAAIAALDSSLASYQYDNNNYEDYGYEDNVDYGYENTMEDCGYETTTSITVPSQNEEESCNFLPPTSLTSLKKQQAAPAKTKTKTNSTKSAVASKTTKTQPPKQSSSSSRSSSRPRSRPKSRASSAPRGAQRRTIHYEDDSLLMKQKDFTRHHRPTARPGGPAKRRHSMDNFSSSSSSNSTMKNTATATSPSVSVPDRWSSSSNCSSSTSLNPKNNHNDALPAAPVRPPSHGGTKARRRASIDLGGKLEAPQQPQRQPQIINTTTKVGKTRSASVTPLKTRSKEPRQQGHSSKEEREKGARRRGGKNSDDDDDSKRRRRRTHSSSSAEDEGSSEPPVSSSPSPSFPSPSQRSTSRRRNQQRTTTRENSASSMSSYSSMDSSYSSLNSLTAPSDPVTSPSVNGKQSKDSKKSSKKKKKEKKHKKDKRKADATFAPQVFIDESNTYFEHPQSYDWIQQNRDEIWYTRQDYHAFKDNMEMAMQEFWFGGAQQQRLPEPQDNRGHTVMGSNEEAAETKEYNVDECHKETCSFLLEVYSKIRRPPPKLDDETKRDDSDTANTNDDATAKTNDNDTPTSHDRHMDVSQLLTSHETQKLKYMFYTPEAMELIGMEYDVILTIQKDIRRQRQAHRFAILEMTAFQREQQFRDERRQRRREQDKGKRSSSKERRENDYYYDESFQNYMQQQVVKYSRPCVLFAQLLALAQQDSVTSTAPY